PGLKSRAALGTYNFTGDLGKMALPAAFAVVAAALGWRHALLVVAAVAIAGAAIMLAALKPAEPAGSAADLRPVTGQDRPGAYWLLFFIHIADSLVRTGFLIFLPFLLRAKGADLPAIGLALSLLFAGGAAGKLVMGWIGARLGVVVSVVITEAATTALIFAVLPLPLTAALVLQPLIGVMLNG